jgi:hypothetical protein
VVWFFVIQSQWMLGPEIGFVVFVGIELLAALFEGILYGWRGRMGWKAGITVSLIANAASALLGLVL